MLMRCQPSAEYFHLHADVVEMPKISNCVLMLMRCQTSADISNFMLMLLRCQPRAEDFQLHVDVVEMPASC
jgi:hypothetical protein